MRFVKAAVVAASVALVPGAVAAQTSTPSTSTQSGTQQPPVAGERMHLRPAEHRLRHLRPRLTRPRVQQH